jgi:hypothetical protein
MLAGMSREHAMERAQADLRASLASVFRRRPPLCGFSVDAELCVGQLSCHPALDTVRASVIAEEIARALSELIDEEPEAADLIRGRTFARTVH